MASFPSEHEAPAKIAPARASSVGIIRETNVSFGFPSVCNDSFNYRLDSDFFERQLFSRLSAAYLRAFLRRAFPCESKWLPRLKRKLSWKSRMCSRYRKMRTERCNK